MPSPPGQDEPALTGLLTSGATCLETCPRTGGCNPAGAGGAVHGGRAGQRRGGGPFSSPRPPPPLDDSPRGGRRMESVEMGMGVKHPIASASSRLRS